MPEAHAPARITPSGGGDYLEVITKAVFQSGISWKIVENKWPGIRDAFRGFDPLAVAALTEREIAQLCEDPRIIRNRKKVEAIVDNARRVVELDEKHRGFRNYLRSHGDFEATVTDLRKNFRFLGDTGCYYFLYVVGESVPEYEDWCHSRSREPLPTSPAG